MDGKERRGAANALGAAINEVSGVVEGMQKAIEAPFAKLAGRESLWSPTQSADLSPRANVHRMIRGISSVATSGIGWVAEATTPPDAASLGTDVRSAGILAGLTSAFGDNLRSAQNALAQPMSVRVNGQVIALDPDALASAFPKATGTIAVFVHGLASNDYRWGGEESFGAKLEREELLDLTSSVTLTYNSGAYIYQNAEDFDELMSALIENWPAPVNELILVGHSMGGLVIQGAADIAAKKQSPWRELVTTVFYLGTPHRGSTLEQFSNAAVGLLNISSYTRPIYELGNRRSAGIKDLRRGTIHEDELDPDDLELRDLARHHSPADLPNANYHLVLTRVLSDKWGVVRDIAGDSLVAVKSAKGEPDKSARTQLPRSTIHEIDGLNHVKLQTHDDVYAVIKGVLSNQDGRNRSETDQN